MSHLMMDDNNDLAIVDNKFLIVDQNTEVRQRLIQNLKTFLGEWFLNTNEGTPYFQIIFDKNANPELIADSLKSVILNTEDVTELVKFAPLDLEPTTRALSVDFEVNTLYGSISISEAIP